MISKKILFPLAALVLAGLACSVNLNIPQTTVKTGPTVTDTIAVPSVDGEAEVELSLGGGELNLNPGAEEGLISGTATYNVADFKPEVIIDGTNVSIEQGDFNLDSIPKFEDDVENEWTLALSADPMTLRIRAGAYVGKYELGGLRIKSLHVKDGASDVELSFSEPNLVEMSLFDYQTGASNVELINLANANFATMVFEGGAGNYTLDFGGDLQRDMTVKVEAGLSNLEIVVPTGVSVKINVDSGLANISTTGAWTTSGDTYIQEGEGPTITINIEVGAGNLELVQSP